MYCIKCGGRSAIKEVCSFCRPDTALSSIIKSKILSIKKDLDAIDCNCDKSDQEVLIADLDTIGNLIKEV